MVAVIHTTWGEHTVTRLHRPPTVGRGHRERWPNIPNIHRMPAQQMLTGVRPPMPSVLCIFPKD